MDANSFTELKEQLTLDIITQMEQQEQKKIFAKNSTKSLLKLKIM